MQYTGKFVAFQGELYSIFLPQKKLKQACNLPIGLNRCFRSKIEHKRSKVN